jgi:hypothetical protein
MSHRTTRRAALAAVPAAFGTLLLDPTRAIHALAKGAPSSRALDDDFPAQEAAAVRDVVTVSHFSLERVRELVEPRPELAKAAWDWGFGDWETALGAASHTGNRDIARYLIDHGARPDLFTAAMMGNLAAVRAFVEETPGLQSLPGPHGISLRRHAEIGGAPARQVLAYLDTLEGADAGPADLPLETDREAYVGTYAFGERPGDRFEVAVHERFDRLTIQRGDGTARTLFHQGDHVFHPAGAPSARIRFRVEDGAACALEIHNPELLVSGVRIPRTPR